MAEKKEKRYVSDNAQLMAEWDWEKNSELGFDPTQLTCGSHTKIWWIGKCGHHWMTSVKARTKGTACPICDGKIVLEGFNDLQTANPHILSEWNWNRNINILPSQVTAGSNKKVWWICEKGHEWEASVKSRNRGTGCPICDGKVVLEGFNDLKTSYPDIIDEWDYEKNLPLTPENIMPGSHTVVWWKCRNGHTWQASPNHRISKGRGCPCCCHNPQVLHGNNDLLTVYPEIAFEWHPIKNGSLSPSQVTANSSQRVWWKCSKGHEWKTTVNHRADGSGCPKCAKSAQTSFPEQAVYFYVKQAYPDAINGYTELFNNHGMELDVYIPSMNIGVEYDGFAFHRLSKNHKRDLEKYKICKQNRVFLIRLSEDAMPPIEKNCDHVVYVDKKLDTAILELSQYLPKLIDVDVSRDEVLIRSMYYSDLENNSLLQKYPTVAEQWDYAKNGELTPNMFTPHSNTTVWWICPRKHSWEASIESRVRGTGCPYCTNNIVLPGFNDLEYKRPDLIKEWDYSKNTFEPFTITPGSGKKAWWICSACGHQWLAEISSRNKGHGCPECAKARRKNGKV